MTITPDHNCPPQKCSRVLVRRGTLLPDGTKSDDDILCENDMFTDVIVTFNGNAYVVPLCLEHKRHHDRAAADRRARRRGGSTKPAAKPERNLLETALTRTSRR